MRREWYTGARRAGRFDSRVVEPGPPPVLTADGILLVYNGADDRLVYRTGWALFDAHDPTQLDGQGADHEQGDARGAETREQCGGIEQVQADRRPQQRCRDDGNASCDRGTLRGHSGRHRDTRGTGDRCRAHRPMMTVRPLRPQ